MTVIMLAIFIYSRSIKNLTLQIYDKLKNELQSYKVDLAVQFFAILPKIILFCCSTNEYDTK